MTICKIKTLASQIKATDSVTTEKKLLELHDLLLEVSLQIVKEHRLLYRNFEESKKIYLKQIRPYLEAAEVTAKTQYALIHFSRPERNDSTTMTYAKALFLHSLCNWFN